MTVRGAVTREIGEPCQYKNSRRPPGRRLCGSSRRFGKKYSAEIRFEFSDLVVLAFPETSCADGIFAAAEQLRQRPPTFAGALCESRIRLVVRLPL